MTQFIECVPVQKTTEQVDLAAVKAKQQATWSSGDFSIIGTTLQLVGESLCEAADLGAGSSVLDVACGNGNATILLSKRSRSISNLGAAALASVFSGGAFTPSSSSLSGWSGLGRFFLRTTA